MKKFLSICLVALCSISAMYAQENDPNSRTGVGCETPVTVQATAVGYNHLTRWEIQNGNGNNVLSTITVAMDGTTTTTGSNYGATVTPGTDNTGAETSTLTLNPLGSTLIDDATLGTVIFEAFFDIDSYTITGTTNDNNMGNVTGGGSTTGNTPVTLTATVNPTATCARFDHWEDESGQTINGDADHPDQLTITPETTWKHGSTHTYKAVFVTKTVTITVTTSDSSKGTVQILAPVANPQP